MVTTLSVINGWRKCDTYKGMLLYIKEWNPILFDYMDESGDHHVKWNKPALSHSYGIS
jgi:hypothetical protein